MNEFDRFNIDFNEINFHDPEVNNERIGNDKFESNKIFLEKLDVGDIVKIKGVNYLVKVQNINYIIPNVGSVDYAGTKIGDLSGELVLFNQKDIATRIANKKGDTRHQIL